MNSMYDIISIKRDGGKLNKEQLNWAVSAYTNGDIPDYQMSALLMAIYLRGIDNEELFNLTEIMRYSGEQISLKEIKGTTVDKHSTGGVGDKLSFTACPIAAAAGIKVPMLSGRSLGHTGGTLDKLESIPNMDVLLKLKEFKEKLKQNNMVVSGQTSKITPADGKLYSLRDATATVSCIELIAASIMSKKLALKADSMVLDIKTGSGAFIKEYEDSLKLCKIMIDTAKNAGRKAIGMISDMSQPLGRNVGNSLEIIESIQFLKGEGENDLIQASLYLAALMIQVGKDIDFDTAYKKAKEVWKNGKALDEFRNFIKSQKGNTDVIKNYSLLPQAKYKEVLISKEEGYLNSINNYEIGMASVEIGAGRKKKEDKIKHGAGFIFKKKIGDKIKKADVLVEIYFDDKQSIDITKERIQKAIKITKNKEKEPKLIRAIYNGQLTEF